MMNKKTEEAYPCVAYEAHDDGLVVAVDGPRPHGANTAPCLLGCVLRHLGTIPSALGLPMTIPPFKLEFGSIALTQSPSRGYV